MPRFPSHRAVSVECSTWGGRSLFLGVLGTLRASVLGATSDSAGVAKTRDTGDRQPLTTRRREGPSGCDDETGSEGLLHEYLQVA